MFEIKFSGRFKKDFKKYQNNAKDYFVIENALKTLRSEGDLADAKYKTHALEGNFIHHFDSHLKPDLILIWKKSESAIILIRLGKHSELFK